MDEAKALAKCEKKKIEAVDKRCTYIGIHRDAMVEEFFLSCKACKYPVGDTD